jgi:hypothetical protein
MNLPDVYEFAVTPQATYILTENGPNIVRIYTTAASIRRRGSLAHLLGRLSRPLGRRHAGVRNSEREGQ